MLCVSEPLYYPLHVCCHLANIHTVNNQGPLKHLCCSHHNITPISLPLPPPLQAQALLRQLERRQLYKYVSEVTLGVDAQRRLAAAGKPSAEEIVGYQSTAATGVSRRGERGGVVLQPPDHAQQQQG